jgi:radical SAM-linked protein
MMLRSCFSVTGRMRFLSHLDLLKLMERAMRRAGIPVAFSQGFNPHPKIAFATAKAVGLVSVAEYFDVELNRAMAPEEFRARLQENCPPGITIKETKEIPPEAPALMAVINCASYQVLVRLREKTTRKELDENIAELFSRKEIFVPRISPKKKKEFDIRPGIFSVSYRDCASQEILFEMDLKIGNEGNVRPSEVVEALHLGEYQVLEITRTGLFVREESGEKFPPNQFGAMQ